VRRVYRPRVQRWPLYAAEIPSLAPAQRSLIRGPTNSHYYAARTSTRPACPPRPMRFGNTWRTLPQMHGKRWWIACSLRLNTASAGRHWLDVAGYADSNGFRGDEIRPNIWRYRDYVIRAFNTDKPTINSFVSKSPATNYIRGICQAPRSSARGPGGE